MRLSDTLVIALRGLRAHKLRSALTMLGLIIGVASVIVLVSAGQGVTNSVNAAVEPVANNITIVPKLASVPGGPHARPLTDDDAAAVAKAPHVAQIAPAVNGSTVGNAGQSATAVSVRANSRTLLSTTVTGTTANWFTINSRQLIVGEYFTDAQARSGAAVAVIGPTVANTLFGSPAAAIGQRIRVNTTSLKVLGVMQDYGQNLNNTVVMPLATARSSVFGYGYQGNELNQITVAATSTADTQAAVREIGQILTARHKISDPLFQDFQVQTLGARVTTFTQMLSLVTGFTPAIAAISLLVGGIGVLNIMLVSVTDRTREIGTRKAVGATDPAILAQFAVEAIALAGFGGLIGVVVGVGLVLAIGEAAPLLAEASGARMLSGFAPVLSLPPLLVAFGISLAIGVIAGGYPAWRAAQLNPIDALRYE